MSRKPLASTLLWAVLILTAPLTVQPEVTTPGDAAPAIGGYSPVSYFTVGRPERGSPRYTSTHAGKVYWLTSAEQVQRFEADPDTYARCSRTTARTACPWVAPWPSIRGIF